MKDPIDRFYAKVDKHGPLPDNEDLGRCHVWTRGTDEFGYGRFKVGTTSHQAHRWIAAYGAGRSLRWDPELRETVNHRCNNRACVRLDHLVIANQLANVADAITIGRHVSVAGRARTHCLRGHEFDAKNTYIGKNGGRHCRACNRAHMAQYRAARKQLAA